MVKKYTEAYEQQGKERRPVTGPKLDVSQLTQIGGKLGSNKGGVYQDDSGHKFYVKEPPTEAHVTNEKVAAALYNLAGARTLNYHDAGPKHVATEMVDLEKNNTSQLTAAERLEAQRDFATHAWTANWDAAGLTGDNQGVVGGKTVTLDVGGALEYRAQGGPKGTLFGTKVDEVDTLRNPSMNASSAKLFGSMTAQQIQASAASVTKLTDDQIRTTVKGAGGSEALADKMIARRDDLAARVAKLGTLQPEPKLPTHEAKHEGDLSQTHPQIHAALSAKTRGNSSERVALRKLLKDPSTSYLAQLSIQSKILTSFQLHHQRLVQKGKAEKAAEIEGKLNKYASKYGMPQYKVVAKTTAEANLGFQKSDIAGAQKLMGGEQYTPEEAKQFNDLVALAGPYGAKEWLRSGTMKAAKAGYKNMSGPEAAHIYGYTTSSTYGAMNKLLREAKGGEIPLKYQNHANALNAALDKLPDYKGEVIRKIHVPASVADAYKANVGKTYEEYQFSSAAKNEHHWSGNLWLHINSRTGKDISRLSAHSHEEEVLFKAGSSFKILKYDEQHGIHHVYAEEVT
jgi:hypothetical protein